ncbi:cytochrome bd ubiquinol oxidase subunit I [Anoxybacillus flavithermus NBRC 109594]|uniref:Cytochrome bd ubiquinol oxidase subunit I n=1 Tax=Anoxybacillus flavithermus NBRC 109594 TaxID=1315967 RepID=R4G6G8_9BACL|nr:cytochrome ubiquinol oxidase subunit I [Anoxybacillus flavithermus]GAC90907.1 cytochrome bd ubiquinol oxidase subunit I [Anoxybacillus flavithermus NBRC 109594]
MSDVLLLSRFQFAITVFYHFLFVPLTIGLIVLIAWMETQHVRTKNPLYRQMADFWGKLFAINFVLGVVTGITMEFQFGTNWSEYSKYMGDIFGSPLAIEALVAFFLESTFMGIWLFGKDKISPKLRAFSIWMVALGTNISALWIITANGFMQNPVGYIERNGRIELQNFWEVVTNPYAWHMFVHTVVSCYIVGAFFVMAVSAWHLLRKQHVEFFKKSFQYGLILGLIAATATPFIGHKSASFAAKMQPAKGAALEAVWETKESLPFHIIQIPDPENERNIVEFLTIPKLGSYFYTHSFDGKVVGFDQIPKDERPNVNIVFYSFRLMVALGLYFVALFWYGFYLYRKNKLVESRRFLKLVMYSVLLPYVAINAGWVVAEVGRQPWTVYGLMRTAEAVSPISLSQIIFSLVSLVLFYTILLIADVYLMLKYAKKGPYTSTATKGGEIQHVS